MRKAVIFPLIAIFILTCGAKLSFAESGTNTAPVTKSREMTQDQAKILEEKKKLIEQLKGKSKEEQARMIEEFNRRIFQKKTEAKEQRVEQKEELKTKLDGFKNQKKAEIAERVSTNLNKINDNQVDAMTKHLGRLQEFLNKLSLRVATAKTNGKDVTGTESAIASAQSAIDAAKAAVEAQAGKDYTLVVGDEATVRADAQAKREALMNDLKIVHEKIKNAKDAVVNAIRTTAKVIGKEGVDNE